MKHVAGHDAFAVVAMIDGAQRLGRIPVSAQIAGYERVPLGQRRRNLVPYRVRLGMSMQKQKRRAASARYGVYVHAGIDIYRHAAKAWKERFVHDAFSQVWLMVLILVVRHTRICGFCRSIASLPANRGATNR
jgi:hypothetical protein